MLSAGTRFGPYEIVNAIGAGGMGEVYRGRDSRLRRDVAIKVLPTLVAADHERLARFEREAQTLAALSHPHIATIFGLEEGPGGARGLIMEIVEGPTLSDRIAQGPMPWPEALTIARQIADALESAHEKSIVHRDLKPANVKLTPAGDVKVLDFGLAKAMDPTISGAGVSNSPTLTARATQMGVILGTAAYMSPEQARGKVVDRRADIWAFGCVLFEMVTGRRVFEGDEVTDVLARLIEREPDWSALPANTAPEMRRLLARCLTKDPKARLRDIGEARVLIDETLAGASPTPASSGVRAAAPAPRPALGSRLVPWGLAGVLGAVALVLFLRPAPAASTPGRTVRADIGLPADVEFFAGPTLSGDGTKLAVIGVRQGIRAVYLRSMDETDFKPLPGTEAASNASLSPDGTTVAFISTDTWLKRVTLASGIVEPVADGADIFSGAGWASDGSIVFSRRGQLVVHPAAGGANREIAVMDKAGGETNLSWPVVTADGASVLFVSRRSTPNGSESRLEVVPFGGGARRVVLDGVDQLILASSNRIVYVRDNALFEAEFDPAAATIRGAPVRTGETIYVGPGGGSAVAASRTGVLAFAPPGLFSGHLVWVSPAGVERVISAPPRGFFNPRVSPDGGRIAFSETGTIWTLDPERGTFTRVSANSESTIGFPAWSQDSRRIYYRSAEGIRVRSADGEGETIVLPNTSTNDYPSTLTPDGALLVFLRITAETGGDIYKTPAGGGEVKPVLVTKAYEGGPQVSPDGNWLLYVSSESGRMEVCLRPLAGPDRKWTVSNGGGLHPLWSRDGRRAFYRSGQQFFEVDVTTSPDVRLSTPKVLFERQYEFGANLTFPNYSISADGREFLVVQREPGGRHLNLVVNWLQRSGK